MVDVCNRLELECEWRGIDNTCPCLWCSVSGETISDLMKSEV